MLQMDGGTYRVHGVTVRVYQYITPNLKVYIIESTRIQLENSIHKAFTIVNQGVCPKL